jgi:1-acyl-sn-glycerol-3-phosphate acyltransferase
MSLPEIFDHFPLNILRKPGRVIMTGTQDTMMKSLRYSRIVLQSGEPMIIFPEGKRSVDGRVDKPKHGVFMLAQECNAPLIPVYLKGFTGLYSRLNPGFHFARLEVEILDPIPVGDNVEKAMEKWYNLMKKKNDDEFSEAELDD